MPPSLINQSPINVNRWMVALLPQTTSLCDFAAFRFVVPPWRRCSQWTSRDENQAASVRFNSGWWTEGCYLHQADGVLLPFPSRWHWARPCGTPAGGKTTWQSVSLKNVEAGGSFLSVLRRRVSLLCSRRSVSGAGVFPRCSYRLTFPKTNPRRYSCLCCLLRRSLTSSDLPNKSVIRKKTLLLSISFSLLSREAEMEDLGRKRAASVSDSVTARLS